jgi:palmitoyl-protein thioesterase
MNISFIINLLVLNNTISNNLPVVVMHGIASSSENMNEFSSWLHSTFDLEVYNVEIGNGVATSLFTPMNNQLTELCSVIYNIPQLKNGFNFIGMSQGGLLARGYVERCNKYPVNNLITLVSPHGGVYDPDKAIKLIDIYSESIQEQLSFSNYWRDPTQINNYLKKCSYLPNINNERNYNEEYKKNIEKLSNFIMVWTKNDEVLGPPESGKFSVYDDQFNVVDLIDTNIYNYNYLGLRKLNESNRLHIYETNCSHVDHRKSVCFDQLFDIMFKFLNEQI